MPLYWAIAGHLQREMSSIGAWNGIPRVEPYIHWRQPGGGRNLLSEVESICVTFNNIFTFLWLKFFVNLYLPRPCSCLQEVEIEGDAVAALAQWDVPVCAKGRSMFVNWCRNLNWFTCAGRCCIRRWRGAQCCQEMLLSKCRTDSHLRYCCYWSCACRYS